MVNKLCWLKGLLSGEVKSEIVEVVIVRVIMYIGISSILIILFTFSLTGTFPISPSQSPGEGMGGVLSKEQVLKETPDADLFEFEGKVYKAGVDWIDERDLTKGEQIGVISEDMATKLPKGAQIYAPKERRDILIFSYDGKEKRYLLMLGE